MWTRQHKQRNTGKLILPAISAVVLSYFGFHALHGEYGRYAMYDYQERAVALRAELEEVGARRSDLERRVQLLHDGTLDRDMLDEQARRALNLSRLDEIVIIRTPSIGN
ncbi:MAG: septum formation initiator family protein [Rhizobiaceae bacterium]